MNKARTIAVCAAAWLVAAQPALAINDTIAVTVGTGTTKTANLISFSGGNVISEAGICDATTANQCASVNSSGQLAVSVPTWGGGTLGAMATYGTSPGAVLVPGVNAFITNTPTVTANAGTNLNTSALATSANQTNKTQFTQLTDGTNAATTYTAYGTPPSGNVPGVNAYVTNATALGQTTESGSSPVVLASNQSVGDPCTFQTKTNVAISTATGTTALVTGVSAKRIYVCSFSLIAPSAVSVSLAEGSSSSCGTSNQAAVIGVATNGTAANGMPLAANGGLTLGSGVGTVAQTATAANYLCLFQSGTVQLAGNLTYVQQ